MIRKSFIECAMDTARVWSQRSEDPYKKVGCCILNSDGRVLSVGYNGLPSKFEPAPDFWENRDYRRKFMIHAEINALSLIKKANKPYLLATTLLPCASCATSIISYGIKNIVYEENYIPDQNALDIFKYYGTNIIRYE
jgi:dCMP deaminase